MKYTQPQQIIENAKELEENLENKDQEIQILKDKNKRIKTILENKMEQIEILKKENDGLREECRVRVADEEKLKDKILNSERENIRLLCEIKSLRKICSNTEKEIASNRVKFENSLNKKSEEIQEMKRNYIDLKKQSLSDTKTLLEMYR